MKFCDKLQFLRKRNGMTQDEFAESLNVSRQTVSKWESDAAYPDMENIQAICKLFQISVNTLLNPTVDTIEKSDVPIPEFDVSALSGSIKKQRLAKNIPQELFAEMLGVSRQSVSRWENGLSVPKTELLIAMLPILEIDLDTLLDLDLKEDVRVETEGDANATRIPDKKRKWRFSRKCVIIPCACVLAVAVVFLAILIIPLFKTDPFGKTAEEILVDTSLFKSFSQKVLDRGFTAEWEADDSKLSLDVMLSEDQIAIGGLCGTNGDEILLPRQKIDYYMKQSYVYPGRYSRVSFTESEYEERVNNIKILSHSVRTDQTASASDCIAAITQEVAKIGDPKVSYSFAKDRFAISRTTRYEWDVNEFVSVLGVMIPALQSCSRFDEFLVSYETGVLLDGETTLSAYLSEMKNNLTKKTASGSVEFFCVVTDGRIDEMSFSISLVYKSQAKTDIRMCFLPRVDEAQKGLDVTVEVIEEEKGVKGAIRQTIEYRKQETDADCKLSFSTRTQTEISTAGQSQSYTGTESTQLNYNKQDHRFTVTIDVGEPSLASTLSGTFLLDENAESLALTVDCYEIAGKSQLRYPSYSFKISTLPSDRIFPQDAPQVYRMNEAAVSNYLGRLRRGKLRRFFADWGSSIPTWIRVSS